MKVRKPISKRVPVRLRHKIQKASAAKQRKEKKLAKKNPEWRTRLKKDPGIPNLFPYKDRVISEIQEGKRKKEEEAQQRKQETQARNNGVLMNGSTATGAVEDEEDDVLLDLGDSDDEADDVMDDGGNDSANPMAALLASARASAKEYNQANAGIDQDSEDDMDESSGDESSSIQQSLDMYETTHAPRKDSSRKAFDKAFKQVIASSDVILYVLDARDPLGTRSRVIEQSITADPSKRLLLVLNKIDFVPPQVLKSWLTHLRRSFPTLPLRASTASGGANTFNHKRLTPQYTAQNLLRALKTYTATHGPTTVGIVGYPNTGKSSLINSLTGTLSGRAPGRQSKKDVPVGAEAGMTVSMQRIKLDGKITLLDSPGIVFPGSQSSSDDIASSKHQSDAATRNKADAQDTQARLVLLNAVPPKEIGDPSPAVSLLLRRMSAQPSLFQSLLSLYGIPEGTLGTTKAEGGVGSNGGRDITNDFLVQVARKRGRLGKGGVPNLHAAAQAVLADWRDGRIRGWVEPPQDTEFVNGDGAGAAGTGSLDSGAGVRRGDEKTIVAQWAEEFKIEGLWGDGVHEEEENVDGDVEMQSTN